MSESLKKNYIFTSERLGYRLLKASDFADYFKLDSDPQVRAFFPNGHLNAEEVRANIEKNINFFNKNGFGVFIAIELATGEFVGRCGFGAIDTGEIEVGYVFLKKYWGKGLASEALSALLAWAEHNIQIVKQIIAFTPIEHTASQRVMQKAGMQFYKQAIHYGTTCVFYQKELRQG